MRGRDQSDLFLVVAGIDDVPQSLSHPVGRIGGRQLVEQEDFDLQHRLQDRQLRSLRNGIVAVANVLQELQEIVKQALDALAHNQLPKDGHRQVRFPHSRGSDEEQPEIRGVFLHEALGPELGRLEAAIRRSISVLANVKVLKRAVFVAARDARLLEQPLGALGFPASATRHATHAVNFDGLPACALALGTILLRHRSISAGR